VPIHQRRINLPADTNGAARRLPEWIGEDSPEQSVLRSNLRLFGGPMKNSALLSQGNIFGYQFEARREQGM
jgi:hypothetical protein